MDDIVFKIKYVLHGPDIEKIVHETNKRYNSKVFFESSMVNNMPRFVIFLYTNAKEFKENEHKLDTYVKEFTKALHNATTIYKYRFK